MAFRPKTKKGATNLAAQFQEAQINSPPDIESMDAVTSPVTKIISTSSMNMRPSSRASKNLDDSFDMLQ